VRALAALLAVLLALGLYALGARDPEGARGVRSDEGAYRLRLCELALFTGESARSDRMLEPRKAEAVPYGALAPAATAFVLARTLPASALDLEHGALDEHALARGARGLGLALAWLAALGLCFAGLRFTANPPRDALAAGITGLAALCWTCFALWPVADGGAVRHQVWGLGLGALILALSALLTRPRSLLDQLGLAIGAGVLVGLALCNDPFAWPLLLAPPLAWLLAGRAPDRSPWRDRLRGVLFFTATALFVSGQGGAWSTIPLPLPSFEPGWQVRAGAWYELGLDLASLGLAAWLVLAAPRGAQRQLLALLLVASLALRFLDPRFSSARLAPAGCAFVALLASSWQSASPSLARRGAALAACALLALLAFRAPQGERDAAVVDALRELRTLTRSSGAWNHALARQEYALLANPDFAGAIAFHARRPVAGALLPGAQPSAAARSAAEALLCASPAELAAQAHALNTPYVLVGSSDWQRLEELLALSGRRARDFTPQRAQELMLRQLLLQAELEGFELLHRVPDARSPELPARLAVWRLTAPAAHRAPATMRAR